MKKIATAFGLLVCLIEASAQSYVDVYFSPNNIGVECAKWSECNKKYAGYGVRVGAAINSEWLGFLGRPGVEFGFQRFGKVTSSGTKSELYFGGSATAPSVTTGPFKTVATSASVTADALTAALTLGGDVADGVSLVGKLGVSYASATVSYSSAGSGNGGFTENHFVPLVGIGVVYQVFDGVSLVGGLEVTKIKFDGQSSRVVSGLMGLRAQF
jgi:OmpA-like transmembrane domain